MNAGRIKLLADKLAMEYAQIGIPTGELYKSIAQSNYWEAKGELHGAIDAHNDRIKDAFYAGYTARNFNEYLLDSEVDKEWKKYIEL